MRLAQHPRHHRASSLPPYRLYLSSLANGRKRQLWSISLTHDDTSIIARRFEGNVARSKSACETLTNSLTYTGITLTLRTIALHG